LAQNHLGLEDMKIIMVEKHSIAKVVVLHLEGVVTPNYDRKVMETL
jgi:hypothetical protein